MTHTEVTRPAAPGRDAGRPAAAPAPEAGPTPYKWRWAALFVIIGADLMDLLDSTITSVAGPSIESALGGTSSQLQWMSAAYTLAFAMLLITGARLGDLFGRRRMFLLGTAAFAATSLLCGLATSPETLIAYRALQGAAAAMMIPQGLAMLRDMFPGRELAAAFGVFGPVMGLGAVVGPIVGGFLVDADLFGTGWRAIFFVNVPVGIAALLAGMRMLPRDRTDGERRGLAHLDTTGMALISATMVLLILPLVQGRESGWPAWTFVCMAGSVPALGLFVAHELRRRRAGRPTLVELSLFRNKAFTSALVVGLLFFSTMVAFMLIVTVYLQGGLGWSPSDAAVALIPFSLGCTVGAALAGAALAPRFGRKVMHAGLAIQMLGVLYLWYTIDHDPAGVSGWGLTPALAVAGLGFGLIMAPYFDIAIAGVSPAETGSASGVLNAVQQLAGALGVAAFGTLFFGYADDASDGAVRDAFTSGVTASLLAMTGVLAVTWCAAFLMPRRARDDADGPAGH